MDYFLKKHEAIRIALAVCMFMAAITSFAQEPSVIQKTKNAFTGDAIQLFGYGQIIANSSEYPDRGQVRMTSNNSFDLARAILFATGKLGLEKQFGYMLMYDFGPNPGLHELYGEWLPADAFNIRFG
ncbi:MAG: hypothetical protein LBQ70_00285, partial [Prevotellaceae bacterium]|nr:hypothetical protein [Prevotellaceae bacterium]